MLNLYSIHHRSNRHLMHELQRNFDELFLWKKSNYFEPETLGPKLKKSEEEDAYIMQLEAPGLSQEEIQITVEKETINIEGKRESITPDGYKMLRQERPELNFRLEETLPRGINNLAVSAKLEAGILSIYLPKQEALRPHVIEVNANNTKEL